VVPTNSKNIKAKYQPTKEEPGKEGFLGFTSMRGETDRPARKHKGYNLFSGKTRPPPSSLIAPLETECVDLFLSVIISFYLFSTHESQIRRRGGCTLDFIERDDMSLGLRQVKGR
jgi:hypothetical protein